MPGKQSLFERLFGKKQPSLAAQPAVQEPMPEPASQMDQAPTAIAATGSAGKVPQPAEAPLEVDFLARRIRRAVESLLENEALTEGLDDSAAKEMLAWATERARQIAGATAAMDEEQAEQVTSEQMRSLRRMVRSAARWASAGEEERQANLENFLEQAEAALGSDKMKSQQAREALQRAGQDSAQRINVLRRLIEGEPPQPLE